MCISLKFSTSVVVIGICSHSLQYSTIFRTNYFRQILQLFMFHFIFRLEKPRERRWHIERAFKTWFKGPDLKYYIKVFNYRDWGKQCCVADLFWPEPNFSKKIFFTAFRVYVELKGFLKAPSRQKKVSALQHWRMGFYIGNRGEISGVFESDLTSLHSWAPLT